MFPRQALEAAARLGEYTLVDRGTWWAAEGWVRECMSVFVRETVEAAAYLSRRKELIFLID